MEKKKAKKGLEFEIEQVNDSIDSEVEAHIRPLLDQISNLKLEKIDLSTKESAAAALPELEKTLEKLSTLRNVTRTLKTLVEK